MGIKANMKWKTPYRLGWSYTQALYKTKPVCLGLWYS